MEPVRREDFPSDVWMAMEDWAWNVTSRPAASTTSIVSLEGRIRPNRCPECYQDEEPCPACQRKSFPRRELDVDLCECIEDAWHAMHIGRVEKSLLRNYFVFKASPRRLVKMTGIRRDDFWFLLLRGAKECFELAKIAKLRRACIAGKVARECMHHEKVSDRAGCLDERAA